MSKPQLAVSNFTPLQNFRNLDEDNDSMIPDENDLGANQFSPSGGNNINFFADMDIHSSKGHDKTLDMDDPNDFERLGIDDLEQQFQVLHGPGYFFREDQADPLAEI